MLILSYPLPHVLEASRVTVAFVADSWLFDPRVRCDQTYITTLVYYRHLPIVELCYASREAGQTVSDILLFIVRVYYLTTVEGKEFLPGTDLSIWATEAGSTNLAWFRVCALWLCYLSGLTLRSFIYEDVGEPTFHPCSLLKQQRTTTYILFKTLSHLGHYNVNLLSHRGAVLSGLGIF